MRISQHSLSNQQTLIFGVRWVLARQMFFNRFPPQSNLFDGQRLLYGLEGREREAVNL